VLHILYAYFKGDNEGINRYEKDLFYSINKSYDLYYLFFLLIIDVREYALQKIEMSKKKRVPTELDLNPNMRFVNNRVINQLMNSDALYNYFNKNKLSWNDNPELIKHIYNVMIDSNTYGKYMTSTEDSYKQDNKFIADFLLEYLLDDDLLYQTLEEYSIYWNDDIEFILSMNIKTIQKLKESSPIKFFPIFKNEEDKEFVKTLFRKVILNHEDNSKIIQENIKNWDIDRIASMDLLVLEMAIVEILEFPSIPIKVSFNEYIELVKFYSTNRSNAFVNGVLDKIVTKLRKDGGVKKMGRGLKE
jgi:N utilization substance protein B